MRIIALENKTGFRLDPDLKRRWIEKLSAPGYQRARKVLSYWCQNISAYRISPLGVLALLDNEDKTPFDLLGKKFISAPNHSGFDRLDGFSPDLPHIFFTTLKMPLQVQMVIGQANDDGQGIGVIAEWINENL